MNAAILQYLKDNGEQLDADIAKALQMPQSLVQRHISQLSASGEVICCQLTRYVGGKKIEGISCRLSAYVPPRATGPKPGAKKAAANSDADVVRD
ncbi:MAG TPA: winged helix-turn-helix domain-containing protein [Burkholderiales bacterium]|jgi:DNA-binding IclR family transcriptional regulator|nr:winged helix-turn-helix domain-containing protein [Burkholderiales bacterium]